MKFVFKAKTQEGQVKEGRVDAVNRELAIKSLQENGLVPIFISQEDRSSGALEELKRIWEKASQKELAVLFRELATLLEAKVTVAPALRAIEDQVENGYLRMVIKNVADDVEDGMSFSDSLAKHPHTFSSLVVSMVRAGEISGSLQRSVSYIADNIEKNYQLTSKIKGAFFYPVFVISACLIIGFLTMTVILPKLTQVIRDMGIDVPWYTKAVMAAGDFMSSYWWAVLVVVIGGLAGAVYYTRTESGKSEWDRLKINIPVVGKLLRSVYLSRFADNFSILLLGGIPIVKALILVSSVVNNRVYETIILQASEEVKTGGNISNVFSRTPYIPPIVSRMVKVGEETGKMDDILKSVSRFYDQEAENTTRNLTSMIEPVLIVILGMGVAVLVFAILLPIYNIVGQM